MGVDQFGQRHRRVIRGDGRVVDIAEPAVPGGVEVDGGKVLSLDPPRVRVRSGETVKVDGYVATGERLAVGDVVVVVRRGGFVLVLGKVVLL